MKRKYKSGTYKMKIVFVWVCLLTKASAFPTEPPPNTEEKKPCCVGPPRVKDENVEHSNTISEIKKVNSLSNTGDGNQQDVAVTETNTPAYSHGFNDVPKPVSYSINVSLNTVDKKKRDSIFQETSMDLLPSNIQQHKLDPKTNNSPKTVVLNDTEQYEKIKKTDITVGDEARHTEDGITDDVDGFYSTEGITLTDISGYSDTNVTKPDPNVIYPSKDVENGSILDCRETDGLCRNTSKYAERKQVTHPTTHNEGPYPTGKSFEHNANVTQNSKKHKNKPNEGHRKPVTNNDKVKKQPDQPKINDRQSFIKYSTKRNPKYASKQQQRYAHFDSHNRYRYRHHRKQSSSESESDSSQQFG
ncbi:uncharacterized protein LOC120915379 isoform X2 [Rana temporaria]|uniref:uncharacterized protein LOC120915379 isoform X2 n=1 Tax=Rana temporaria TaxID=8407 RepID=UPI001AAD0FBF|nr:uncharacterized protein LOC120915379 isoform X2 [Rana temporaria]